MARTVTASELNNEFATKRVKYREHIYVVTELPMAKYDKTVKQATNKNEDTGADVFDSQAHNRILLAQTVTEDGKPVDVDELYGRGTRLVRQLQRVVQDLHFEDEPEEEIEDVEVGEATAGAK